MTVKKYVDYNPKTGDIIGRCVEENNDGSNVSTNSLFDDPDEMAKEFYKQIGSLLSKHNIRGGLFIAWDDDSAMYAAGTDLNGEMEDTLMFGIGQMLAHIPAEDCNATENIEKFYNFVMNSSECFQRGLLSELPQTSRDQMLQYMKQKNRTEENN